MSQTNKFRIYVLTGSFAAITATGAWYGAGLKTRQEFHQERKQALESSTADKIAHLEQTKAKLMRERADLVAKIERLSATPPSSPAPSTGS